MCRYARLGAGVGVYMCTCAHLTGGLSGATKPPQPRSLNRVRSDHLGVIDEPVDSRSEQRLGLPELEPDAAGALEPLTSSLGSEPDAHVVADGEHVPTLGATTDSHLDLPSTQP